MEDDTMEGSASPVSDTLSAEFYYLKALRYIATSGEGSSADGHCSCLHCPSSEDKMEDDDDDHFSTGFRPGLTLDDLQGCGMSSETSSLSQFSTSPPSASVSFLHDHKNGASGKTSLKTRSGEPSRKLRLKRKLSDGHVHWADEFQKDLTRCNPRKSYTRHPSMNVAAVKPILKATSEDGDHS